MSHSTSTLRLYLKLAILLGLLGCSSISYALLQATTIPQFSLDLDNPNQPYTEIISFCVFNDEHRDYDYRNHREDYRNYKVNICSSHSDGLFASSNKRHPLKFKLLWKGDHSDFVELNPCMLSSDIFVASTEFNCGGKENAQVKLIIEPDWIQDAEMGRQRLPLTFNLVPA